MMEKANGRARDASRGMQRNSLLRQDRASAAPYLDEDEKLRPGTIYRSRIQNRQDSSIV